MLDRNDDEITYDDVVVDPEFIPQRPRIKVVHQAIYVGWCLRLRMDIKIVW